MTDAFLAGALAGYAIAIPVGAIAVLIVELGIRRGFAVGAAAGAGAASADGLYAGLAMVGGSAVADAIAPHEAAFRLVAAAVLVGVALRGFLRLLRRPSDPPSRSDPPRDLLGTYLRFVAITLVNPMTVVYFAALSLGLPTVSAAGDVGRAAFVVGAFGASLSWQLVLAALGAIAHHRLPARFQLLIGLAGNLLIVGFAVVVATGT
jgi:threonine/homoserine/homoserine lactone efflux protein